MFRALGIYNFALISDQSVVLPVCLPWNEDDPGRTIDENDQLLMSGWGQSTNKSSEVIENLQKFQASTSILQELFVQVNDPKCQEEHPDFTNATTQICIAGERGTYLIFNN